ncbi:MAG: class II fumarate hydratase [Gammaproteobacteria bacterium]|nr:class II fumarate hydratase [Gammaproteobacteria bacterium]
MKYRIEKDSMGELKVPEKALYAAQTQRAVENFPISGLSMPRAFIRALGLVKIACAKTNADLGFLEPHLMQSIVKHAQNVADGVHDEHFPVDVFQTGSGTSTNMNANEVIATLCQQDNVAIHPNDHVNMGQSSNDVIPTALHVSASESVCGQLLPALDQLEAVLAAKANSLAGIVKTGRTHLMDAMPVSMQQEISGWQMQIKHAKARIMDCLPRLNALAQGGTAVGTGINADQRFAANFARQLSDISGQTFTSSENKFESLSTQDSAVELSGQLKTLAVSLMKICNDLRWMNSGPLAGIGEIALPALQPGSSIMPGKVNPVIPEAVAMVCAQVIGNDATITVAGQSGNFQLNVMLPVIAYNLLQSIDILANASSVLASKAIQGFTVNEANIKSALEKNPILVTALNPVIGYELGATIAKTAYAEDRAVIDVAEEMTGLSRSELEKILNPMQLTKGGITE